MKYKLVAGMAVVAACFAPGAQAAEVRNNFV